MNLFEKRRRREIQAIIYRLKRRLGVPLSYHAFTAGTPNVETGSKGSPTVTVYQLSRVIVYQRTLTQRFEYDLSFIAANKNFTYGAIFEVGDRVCVIDGRDLPVSFRVQTDDYIIFQGTKYLIHSYTELELRSGYMLHLRSTQGTKPLAQVTKYVEHVMTLEQEVTDESDS